MTWILVLAFGALAAAVAIAAHRGLLALKVSQQDAWQALEAQLVKRQELAARIVELCSKPMRGEREALERAAIAGRAVLGAAKARNVPALAAAEKSYRAAFAALIARAESHAQCSGSAGFAALCGRMRTLDARVDERTERYNAAVSVLNLRCRAFPYSLVARTAGVTETPFLP